MTKVHAWIPCSVNSGYEVSRGLHVVRIQYKCQCCNDSLWEREFIRDSKVAESRHKEIESFIETFRVK